MSNPLQGVAAWSVADIIVRRLTRKGIDAWSSMRYDFGAHEEREAAG